MTDALLIKILNQLRRIADTLEKANKLTIEKQKAELEGKLTKAEKEWLKEKAV